MNIVIDTSAVLAVIVNEPERSRIVRQTTAHTLIGPGSIPWEIGNAFSSMLKQKRLKLEVALEGIRIFESIPIRYVTVDFSNTLAIASEQTIYAYDAYFIDCATRHQAPLLTLDRRLKQAATNLGVEVMEV